MRTRTFEETGNKHPPGLNVLGAIIGGAAAGAGGGLIGGGMQYLYNKKLQKITHDFQERMSNTQYQRTMADMRLAGLNPILAAKFGGGGAPPGASASVSQTDLVSSAKTGSQLKPQVALLKAQIEAATTSAEAARQQALRTQSENFLLHQTFPEAQVKSEPFRIALGAIHSAKKGATSEDIGGGFFDKASDWLNPKKGPLYKGPYRPPRRGSPAGQTRKPILRDTRRNKK